VKDNFILLYNAGIINKELLNKMKAMVGFRNIAIHDYASLDTDILKSILVNNLRDLEEFYTTILKRFNIL
jgi:uncharacterized protein YutE (UPF0331/DUF86 family)